jgi:4-hydroxythreonine-4-phosphate dehydrogenase
MATVPRPRRFALTLGDPAGIGPEIALRALAARLAPRLAPGLAPGLEDVEVLLVGERAALEAALPLVPELDRDALVEVDAAADRGFDLARGAVALLDPVARQRAIEFGASGAADAHAALAALDAAIALARAGAVDAIVTAPVSKSSIAAHVAPGFVGHTDYLAAAFGLERYGRDYLMAFLAPELQVALLSVHEPLARAIRDIESTAVVDALLCLDRHAGGRVALAALNPHAGEGGLLGREDDEILRPAVAAARERGIDVRGPESADSLFARQRQGEFDWVLALYHDQGLIAVKTASFGLATNWTLGLPVVRTSVDHGTAFALAGTGKADARPMIAVLETTVALLDGRLPRRAARGAT